MTACGLNDPSGVSPSAGAGGFFPFPPTSTVNIPSSCAGSRFRRLSSQNRESSGRVPVTRSSFRYGYGDGLAMYSMNSIP